MPAHWPAAFVLSDNSTGSRSEIRVLHDLVGVRDWQPGLVKHLVAFRDDLRTRSGASGFPRGNVGAERPRAQRGRRR
jgi:hypothetical protein